MINLRLNTATVHRCLTNNNWKQDWFLYKHTLNKFNDIETHSAACAISVCVHTCNIVTTVVFFLIDNNWKQDISI